MSTTSIANRSPMPSASAMARNLAIVRFSVHCPRDCSARDRARPRSSAPPSRSSPRKASRGRRRATWPGRAGVSVAALYHHFPSKLGLLREFLDEAYSVTLARIDRRLEGVDGPVARLENVVAHPRVDAPARRVRAAGVDRRDSRVHAARSTRRAPRSRCSGRRCSMSSNTSSRDGVRTGDFASTSRARPRAIVSLTTSFVGDLSRDRTRHSPTSPRLYQEFAVRLAGASGSRPRA